MKSSARFTALSLQRPGCAAALLAVGVCAALVWFGNSLNPWWPLLWFAPLPVLLFAVKRSARSAAAVAAGAWFIGNMTLLRYFQALHSAGIWIGICCGTSLVFTAAVLLFRALLDRDAAWSALAAFPAAWVSCEYASSVFTPNGTAGSLAYTQLKFLPFLQVASLTGPWGMSFLLFLLPASLAITLHLYRSRPRQALSILGTGIGLLAASLLFGYARLAPHASDQRGLDVKVGLIASDASSNVETTPDGSSTRQLLSAYAAVAQSLAARSAQVIVLPEKIGTIMGGDSSAADAVFQPFADRTGAAIVVGLVHAAGGEKYNEARAYLPRSMPDIYRKQHLLAPFEMAMQPGRTLTLLPKSAGPWALAVCKDMDFAQPARSYGNAGVGLMLVPAWDFDMDRVWHGHIALMRGVEDGFTVVRAAKQGYLTVSDDRGRILGETRSDSAPFAALLVNAPAQHANTLYLRFGDWFAWLSLALLATSVLHLISLRDQVPKPGRREVATEPRPH